MAILHDKAIDLATQIVIAAAHAGNLKLDGVPMGDVKDATQSAEKDGAYVATLVNTIANKIKTGG
jgi:hypothetical protein